MAGPHRGVERTGRSTSLSDETRIVSSRQDEVDSTGEAATRLLAADDATRTLSTNDATRISMGNQPSAPVDGTNDEGFERGAMVGRYVVLEKLGAGGMGVVYLAYDPELDRRVALKLIRTHAATTDEEERTLTMTMRSRLLREAQALAKLSHPNVVTVFDVGMVEDAVFIAMAYLEGQTLRAWLREKRRTWKEVLPIAIAAGRGLAAAHAAGLVHRDFKPDNVIIDSQGRGYVLDFGLAHADRGELDTVAIATDSRPLGSPTDEIATVVAPSTDTWTGEYPRSSPSTMSSGFAVPLTEAGTVMGTPPYMAPEQFAGLTDARTDQFAFCVSLFEALYGRRPFSGADERSRIAAIERGPVWEADDRRVPTRLRRILARGLMARPEQRFPSLDELLDELGRDPWVRRRRWLAATAAVASLGTAGVAYQHVSTAALRQCNAGVSAMSETWNDARRSTIAAAFSLLKDPSAPHAWSKSAELIDAYTQEWTEGYTAACQATHEAATQSAELLDLRMSCLSTRLDSLRATVDILEQPDEQTAKQVINAIYQLSPVADCADTQALLADVPPPSDPQVRARVEEIRRELSKLDALKITERFPEILPQVQELLERAKDIDYGPLQAELHMTQLDVLLLLGRTEEGDEHIELAVYEAERAGALALAANAEMAGIWTKGYMGRDFVAAARHQRHATALLEAANNPPDETSMLHHLQGILAGAQGDQENCKSETRKGLEIRRKHFDPEDPRINMSLNNLAVCSGSPTPEDTDEAIKLLREVAERYGKLWKNPHPDRALAIGNIASAMLTGGRYRDAIEQFAPAIEMWTELKQTDDPLAVSARHGYAFTHLVLGQTRKAMEVIGRHVDDPIEEFTTCNQLTNERAQLIAMIYLMLGRLDPADQMISAALEQCIALMGPNHRDLMPLRTTAAQVALRRNDLARAKRELTEALKDAPEIKGTEVARQHDARVALGQLYLEQGDALAAVEQLEAALRDAEPFFSPQHPVLGDVLTALGKAYARTGEPTKATKAFARALANVEAALGEINPNLMWMLLAYAEFEQSQGNFDHALELLERARKSYVEGDTNPDLLPRVEELVHAVETARRATP